MKTDTIAAIATAMSPSGIGIIRISGEESLSIIDKIYRREKQRSVILCLVEGVHRLVVYLIETRGYLVLPSVSRYSLRACKHFLGKSVKLSVLFCSFAEERTDDP